MDTLLTLYPSPRALIVSLTDDVQWSLGTSYLEPGGGTGNICRFIKEKIKARERYYRDEETDVDLDVIEISPQLQHVLTGEKFRLIHDDFLTFETYKTYDYIIANFPFDKGAEHLDKALRLIARNGGGLRCVVNAETLRNPFTTLRKAVAAKLEQMGARIEYRPEEFTSAERRTNVEIAIIKVDAKRPEPLSIILEHLEKAPQWRKGGAEDGPAPLVSNNFVDQICAVFDKECAGGVAMIEEFHAMKPYVLAKLNRPGDERQDRTPLIKLEIEGKNAGRGIAADVTKFLRLIRKKYWEVLIHDDRFSYQYTSNILKEMDAKLDELKEYDFTPFNIRKLHLELQSKVVAGVEAAILDLFDMLTSRYAYDENYGSNYHYFNGWKTNKGHFINHRVILPLRLLSHWNPGHFDYDAHKVLSDMVKVFNYLSKDKVDAPQLVSGAMKESEQEFKRWRPGGDMRLDLKYFSMRVFKGGTVHIKFKDLELLKKFNIFGCQKKKWLPPEYGKKKYTDLTPEEKAVVDSFHGPTSEGKEDYDRIVKNRDFYLIDSQALVPVGFDFLNPDPPPPDPEPETGPILEAAATIGVQELAEAVGQMSLLPDLDETKKDDPPGEPRKITRAQWDRQLGKYDKDGVRYIVENKRHIPVEVIGMSPPRRK